MNRVRLVLASTLAVASVFAGSVAANADPDAVDQARKDLAKIQQESSSIDQDIIEAHERVTENQTKLSTLTEDVKKQETRVADLTEHLGDVGAVKMQSDSVSLAAQLLTSSDADNFLSGLGVIQVETDRSNAGIQQLQLDQAKLTTMREDVESTQKQLEKDQAAKVSLSKDYDAKEAEAQAVYDRLSTQERQRLAEQQAAEAQQQEAAQVASEARTAAEQGTSRSQTTAGSEASTDSGSSDTPAASGSGRAQDAVNAALSKVGSSYVWGTSGPSTFDCSGLTSWAYRQVGVSLTRSSRVQYSSAGRKVSKSELQPGDLVFYYSPVSHVGLYIGNGKIVDAANPRSGVRVTSLDSMPFSGARRVIG